MKKLLTLLLVLVLSLALVACGGEAAPAEDEAPAPAAQEADAADPDYEQLTVLMQTVYSVEASLTDLGALRDAYTAGTATEQDLLDAYAAVNEQAAAAYNEVEAAEWQSDTYAQPIDNLHQAAEAIAIYTDTCYEAMVAGDADGLEAAAPYFETYMAQMDALLTALGV